MKNHECLEECAYRACRKESGDLGGCVEPEVLAKVEKLAKERCVVSWLLVIAVSILMYTFGKV